MRICHLNPYFFPYAGGIERRILELGKRLSKRHEVFVLTSQLPGTEPEEEWHGLQIRRLPSKYRLEKWWNPPLVKTPGVVEAMRRIGPDVIDFHYRWAPNYSRAFLGSGRFSRLVFTYHNTYGEGTGLLHWASLANDWWTKRFISRSDRIVCISRFIRDDLLRRRFPPDRLTVVPNGIDAAALASEASMGQRPAPLQGIRFVAAVGRLVPTKGYDLLVRALPRLPRDVHVAICGEGPDRAPLERLARRLGVANRLHLLGWVPEADKLRLVQDATAFAHPARFESFGMSVLEAMAVGAPIVAARVGGLPEVVGDAGFLVQPDNVDPLVEALQRVLGDPALEADARQRSHARSRELSWDAAAHQMERVYDALLQAPLTVPEAA